MRRAAPAAGGEVTRRPVLAGLAAMIAEAACGGRPPAAPVARAFGPASVVEVVPAAGLAWLVEARPRDLLASPALAGVVGAVITGARFEAFARRHGGVDLRRAEELVVARYATTTLVLARVGFAPTALETAFDRRADPVERRSPAGDVLRLAGVVDGQHEELALFGREVLVASRGAPEPLQAALYFAEGRLRRSRPALRAEPLAAAAEEVGAAPLRVFAPGPFEGEIAQGAAGLLRGATAMAGAASAAAAGDGGAPAVAIRAVLLGGWGKDAAAAGERLRAAFDVVGSSAIGRLTGLDRPLEGPSIDARPEALVLSCALDAAALGRGLRAFGEAGVAEIMGE